MQKDNNKWRICNIIIRYKLLPFEVSNDLVPCACLGNYEDSI